MPDISGISGTATSSAPVGSVSQPVDTGGVWSANGTAKVKKGGSDMDKDTFLKLLVAQLKYQDPSNPTDSSQFMAQTAQFSMVEKLDALAKQNADLLSSQRMLQGSSLVGRKVGYPAADGTTTYGVVSSAKFTSDGPVLHIGDTDVPIGKVTEVTQLTAPAAAAAPPVAPPATSTSSTPKD